MSLNSQLSRLFTQKIKKYSKLKSLYDPLPIALKPKSLQHPHGILEFKVQVPSQWSSTSAQSSLLCIYLLIWWTNSCSNHPHKYIEILFMMITRKDLMLFSTVIWKINEDIFYKIDACHYFYIIWYSYLIHF